MKCLAIFEILKFSWPNRPKNIQTNAIKTMMDRHHDIHGQRHGLKVEDELKDRQTIKETNKHYYKCKGIIITSKQIQTNIYFWHLNIIKGCTRMIIFLYTKTFIALLCSHSSVIQCTWNCGKVKWLKVFFIRLRQQMIKKEVKILLIEFRRIFIAKKSYRSDGSLLKSVLNYHVTQWCIFRICLRVCNIYFRNSRIFFSEK